MKEITFSPAGDCAVSALFGDTIDPVVNRKIRKTRQRLADANISGITELIPAYCSLLVCYDPLEQSYSTVCRSIKECAEYAQDTDDTAESRIRIVEIPTVYGGRCNGEYGGEEDFAPDLPAVARHTGLTEKEVITLHSSTDYLVYMLGFMPGFAYLGGMNPRLAAPRLPTPRSKIPAGSVGIAGMQTGIYPSASPGGWQIIGRTPLILYDDTKEPPALLSAGDYVRYIPITIAKFWEIKENIAEYKPVIHLSSEAEIREYQQK